MPVVILNPNWPQTTVTLHSLCHTLTDISADGSTMKKQTSSLHHAFPIMRFYVKHPDPLHQQLGGTIYPSLQSPEPCLLFNLKIAKPKNGAPPPSATAPN